LRDPALQAGIINLCQNRIIHRIPEPSEAVRLMQQMLTIYINNITLTEEAQDLERFMADDIMRLPDHTAICQWQAKGAVQSPFVAETIDWRPDAQEEWAAWHKDHQSGWLPPEEPETFDTPEDHSTLEADVTTDRDAHDEPSAIPVSPAPDMIEDVDDQPTALSEKEGDTEWTVAKAAKVFGLTENMVLNICQTHYCSVAEMARVLTDHEAERPAFTIQVTRWLSEHPEWFPQVAYSDEQKGPSHSIAASDAPDEDQPWLLKP
jgi:hypothetical protein